MNRADKNWVHFPQTFFLKILSIFDGENNFKNQNFEIFAKVVHNFGKFDDDII